MDGWRSDSPICTVWGAHLQVLCYRSVGQPWWGHCLWWCGRLPWWRHEVPVMDRLEGDWSEHEIPPWMVIYGRRCLWAAPVATCFVWLQCGSPRQSPWHYIGFVVALITHRQPCLGRFCSQTPAAALLRKRRRMSKLGFIIPIPQLPRAMLFLRCG